MITPRLALAVTALAASIPAQTGFVNWETPHVHPLERGPQGLLLAVNTPDGRLEAFQTTDDGLVALFSVPVGVDPVSVRYRGGHEAWVVNQLSDSVSIVDLAARNVVATLATEDEPADVVFSRGRAFVSCSQANSVLVFDLDDLAAVPRRVAIEGEDPRALAVGPHGEVYAAIFESGNATTVLGGGLIVTQGGLDFPPNVVDDPTGPWGGVNPPPNSGAVFEPPIDPALPAPPGASLIVRRDAAGKWLDDNGGDWTELVSGSRASLSGRPVGWDLADHDVAVIDGRFDRVRYVRGLMTTCMALAVHPVSGALTLVGTEAKNEVRFEPNVTGVFVRAMLARVDPEGHDGPAIVDLNPHLDYSVPTLPQSERDRSLGDPRSIVWSADGGRGYVAGMGSNNVVVVDALGDRVGAPIEVGEGPTGLALDGPAGRLYVLNKFESSISVVDTAAGHEIGRLDFFDPEPPAIKAGRVHLYGTHETSGLGQVACASCHVDARLDRLAWDLGDPSGDLVDLQGQNKGMGFPGLKGGFSQHHPMKGPMTTQTLQDIIGKEPLHWRGDRDGLEEFNGAFIGLQGDDQNLTAREMQEFEDFLATIHFPPNPFRELDNSLSTDLPLPGHVSAGRFAPAGTPLPNGNAKHGLALFRPPNFLDDPLLACATCHTLPSGLGADMEVVGANFEPFPIGPLGERHHALVAVDGTKQVTMKVPQLRNLYDKVGFDLTQPVNRAGFGFMHDGAVDTLARFVEEPAFFPGSLQDVADLVAFLLSFSGSDLPAGKVEVSKSQPPGSPSQDTHAAVGRQATIAGPIAPATQAFVDSLVAMAAAGDVGLIVKGSVAGEARGFAYDPATGRFQSDRAAESWDPAQVVASAQPGGELTYTAVPSGTEVRAGIDRDSDGWFDRDELDAGSDPANPASTPGAAPAPAPPARLTASPLGDEGILLEWRGRRAGVTGWRVERALSGSSSYDVVALLPPGAAKWRDRGLAPGRYDYRVAAVNAAGSRGFAGVRGAETCQPAPAGAPEPGGEPALPTGVRSGH
jgi:YVTN family beta-propeller protein